MTTTWKLSTRILLGYLVPCLAFAAAVIAVYVESARLQHTIAESERIDYIVEQGYQLEIYVTAMQSLTRGALLRPGETEHNFRTWQQKRADYDKAVAMLRKTVHEPSQFAMLDRLVDSVNAMNTLTQAQFERMKSNRRKEALAEFDTGSDLHLRDDFDRIATQFFERERQLERVYRDGAADGIVLVKTIVFGTAVFSLLVSLLAGWLIATRTAKTLRELISVIAASSTQIAATTEQHEGAMTQQASAVTETTATVEEMVATARTNAEQAEQAEQAELATQSAGQAQGMTREGLELVMHNEANMVAMEETMNRVGEQIVGLSERAGQIGEIARVVGELAAETNMLALNAAVEAARAGEQGRGFAVVATEIRKLADQSKKSAERANQLVSDIQNATNGMVMTAEEGSKTTHSAAASAHSASQAFEKVIHLADQVVENGRQVLLNSKQQAVALAQIDIAMKSINSGAREMATGTVQMREGMSRLSGVAVKLNRML